jgi:hypothetical protein
MRLMASHGQGRKLGGFLLDGVFLLWLLYILASGQLLPPAIAELLHPADPAVATVEPLGAPYDGDSFYELRPDA